jgi:pilus assembly protein TadC
LKTFRRIWRGARLFVGLGWAIVSGLVEGIFSVLVLLFYRICLLIALSAGALLFALFRIDMAKRKRNSEESTP